MVEASRSGAASGEHTAAAAATARTTQRRTRRRTSHALHRACSWHCPYECTFGCFAESSGEPSVGASGAAAPNTPSTERLKLLSAVSPQQAAPRRGAARMPAPTRSVQGQSPAPSTALRAMGGGRASWVCPASQLLPPPSCVQACARHSCIYKSRCLNVWQEFNKARPFQEKYHPPGSEPRACPPEVEPGARLTEPGARCKVWRQTSADHCSQPRLPPDFTSLAPGSVQVQFTEK